MQAQCVRRLVHSWHCASVLSSAATSLLLLLSSALLLQGGGKGWSLRDTHAGKELRRSDDQVTKKAV